MLNVENIAVDGCAVTWRIRSFDEVDSTNIVVKDALRANEPEGFVACALRQTGGYGRQGRGWSSPAGGLYFSFGLRPGVPSQQLPPLALVAGLSVRAALVQLGLAASCDVALKWPNDVMLSGAKACGISCESLNGQAVCIGIGINVFVPEQGAQVAGKYRTAYVAGRPIRPGDAEQVRTMEQILQATLCQFDARYALWLREGFAALQQEFNDVLYAKGKAVVMETIEGAKRERGIIRSVDGDGRLLVEDGAGAVRAVSSGEVHFV